MGIFSQYYKTGEHQYSRLFERTDFVGFNALIDKCRVVLTTPRHRYLNHKNIILPVVLGDDGVGIVRTVLTDDMDIYPN